MKKIVVLDLDQTLLATQDYFKDLLKFQIIKDPVHLSLRQRTYYFELYGDSKGKGEFNSYWGITRPHTHEFLQFCFKYFDKVIVWSAGQYQYVHEIVKYLFRHLPQPHAILTYNDIDRNIKGHVEKPITKLMKLHPELGVTHENTLFIDDNPTTFIHNKDNAIYIPEYNPPLNLEDFNKFDEVLPQLITWLLQSEVINSSDVRKLDKTQIFT